MFLSHVYRKFLFFPEYSVHTPAEHKGSKQDRTHREGIYKLFKRHRKTNFLMCMLGYFSLCFFFSLQYFVLFSTLMNLSSSVFKTLEITFFICPALLFSRK